MKVVYCRYTYDTWGNTLHIYDANGTEITYAENLAVQNPFRYRGYYYDAETGRFLNADDVEYIGYSGEDISYNAFVYCENNAVNCVDCTGENASRGSRIYSNIKKADKNTEKSYWSKKINIYTPYKGRKKEGKINILIDDDGGIGSDGKINGNPNIRIWNSYEITDESDMYIILDIIMDSKYFDNKIFTRSRLSYYIEWFGHNTVYQITSIFIAVGVSYFETLNERAKHVDLDNNEKYMALWTTLYLFYLEGQT